MSLFRSAALAAAAVALVGAPLVARDYRHGSLIISKPWSRATSPRADTGAGFATFHNSGDRPDRLIAATTPIATEVQLHSMEKVDGIMRMRPLPNGLEIPAKGTAELAPGGNHIMFLGLKRALREGEAFPVTLRFEHAGKVAVRLKVEGPGAQGPSDPSEGQR